MFISRPLFLPALPRLPAAPTLRCDVLSIKFPRNSSEQVAVGCSDGRIRVRPSPPELPCPPAEANRLGALPGPRWPQRRAAPRTGCPQRHGLRLRLSVPAAATSRASQAGAVPGDRDSVCSKPNVLHCIFSRTVSPESHACGRLATLASQRLPTLASQRLPTLASHRLPTLASHRLPTLASHRLPTPAAPLLSVSAADLQHGRAARAHLDPGQQGHDGPGQGRSEGSGGAGPLHGHLIPAQSVSCVADDEGDIETPG